MLLPYWLCEHASIIEPINKVAFPRFLRWDLTSLNKALKRVSVTEMKAKKVLNKELNASLDEQDTVLGLIRFWDAERSDDEIEETQMEGNQVSRADQGTTDSDDDSDATIPISTPVKDASVRNRRLILKGRSSSKNQGSNSSDCHGNMSVNMDNAVTEGSLVKFGSVRTSSLGIPNPGTGMKQPESDAAVEKLNSAVDFVVGYCVNSDLKQKYETEMEDFRRVILEKDALLMAREKVIADQGKIVEGLKAQLCDLEKKDKEIWELKREIELSKTVDKDVVVAELKKKTEEIEVLRAEVDELKRPLTVTQILEDPENIKRIEIAEDLGIAISENEALRLENAMLHEQIADDETPDKEPQSKRIVTPGSIARNVKVRTEDNTREPVVVSPQRSTADLIDVDAMVSNPGRAGGPAKQKKFRLDEKCEAVKQSRGEIKTIIRDLWTSSGEGHEVWTGDGGVNRVFLADISMILHHDRLSSAVIDSWAEMLQKLAKRVSVCQQIIIFSGLCWEIIYKAGAYSQATIDMYVDSKLQNVKVHDTLYFPLVAGNLTGENAQVGDHWTLLKLDILNSKWKFFNPLRPRLSDPHLQASFCVCDYVEEKLAHVFSRTRPDHPIASGKALPWPQSEYEAQQMPGSLDCGIVVCYHLENAIFHKESQKGILSKKLAGEYRKRMVEWLMQPLDTVVGLFTK